MKSQDIGCAKIKVDFNLLLGIWVIEKKGKQVIHKFEKEVGDGKFIIYNALDVPSVLDNKVLDFLMLKSQEQNWQKELSVGSLRQLAKELHITPNNKQINRLKRALDILVNTRIKFVNCFIDTGVLKYFKGRVNTVDIGILSDYGLIPTKGRGNPLTVKVIFNDNFIALCKHSLGYKLIPYAPIQGLRDTAYALYKWAYRWYDSEKGYGERWIGNGQSLVKWYKNELNSIAQYKYPSEILRRLKSAIKQLNENPEVPFYLQLKEENNKYKLGIYRKDQCTLKREIPFDKLPAVLRKAVIKLIIQKKYIKEPYALARSMSWREIENELKKVVLIPIPEDTWSTFRMLLEATRNDAEKTEIEQTILATEKRDSEVFVVVLKSKLRRSAFFKWLDSLLPNWRTFLQEAVGLLNEKKVLVF